MATTKAESSGGGTATTDFAYKDVSGGVEITDYYGSTLDVSIPATIDGKAVVSIGDAAFERYELTSVTIPNSVTSIGGQAFDKNQVTSVTIGADVSLGSSHLFAAGVFDEDGTYFESVYEANGKSAGTYTRPDSNSTDWVKK